MTTMVLYKAPDVPVFNLLPEAGEPVVLKELEHAVKTGCEGNEYPLFICTAAFMKEKRTLMLECGATEASVIVIEAASVPEIDNDPLVFRWIPDSAESNIARSVRNLARFHRQKLDYEKANYLNRELLSIGVALSAERDNDKLLNDILYKIRQITRADAGSLYLLEGDELSGEQTLLFKIAHNDSNPSDFTEFSMPLNTASIAGYVAVTSKTLNIEDVYNIPDSAPYSFNKSYDIATNYRSRSILTVPMVDHLENIIGVIQLINRKKSFATVLETPEKVEENVEPFDFEDEYIVLSLASQAAVSLENNILYTEIETLFEGFVAASVKAIESRDPTTSGHSSRVAGYCVETARAINECRQGVFSGISFTEEQIKELRYAGLLHDFGKVGVREPVLIKAKKLYPGQLDLLRMRFAYIRKCAELDYAVHGDSGRLKAEVGEIDAALEIIEKADEPSIGVETPAGKLDEYHRKTYVMPDGGTGTWLTDYEYEMLSISKGSLTGSERKEIESHVVHSHEFLRNIPWTSGLKGLPDIARGHHERPDGTGYPDGKTGDQMSVQSLIMAVADIYDALTANDRPYKKALSPETALRIIREEAGNNHLDKDIVEIFIGKRIYEKVSQVEG